MTFKKFMMLSACVLTAVLLFTMCTPMEEHQNTATFYYVRSQFAYGVPDGVIGSEEREIGGHEGDLRYLLALYLEGPMDQNLVAPFPGKAVTRILSLEQVGNALHIELSDLSVAMTDSEFTLACACLTRTCLGLAKVHAVQVTSGDRSVRMNLSNLQFYDESTSVIIPETEEEK